MLYSEKYFLFLCMECCRVAGLYGQTYVGVQHMLFQFLATWYGFYMTVMGVDYEETDSSV